MLAGTTTRQSHLSIHAGLDPRVHLRLRFGSNGGIYRKLGFCFFKLR